MCGSTTLGGKLFFHAVVEEMGWSADDGDVEEGDGRCSTRALRSKSHEFIATIRHILSL